MTWGPSQPASAANRFAHMATRELDTLDASFQTTMALPAGSIAKSVCCGDVEGISWIGSGVAHAAPASAWLDHRRYDAPSCCHQIATASPTGFVATWGS